MTKPLFSSALGIEKMRTRKYSPSNEDAFRHAMLYYWYFLQWSGRSQGIPLWYACKARPGADKPHRQIRHVGDPPPSFSHRSIQSSGRWKSGTIPHSLHTPSTWTRLARPFFLVASLSSSRAFTIVSFCSWAALVAASGLDSAMAEDFALSTWSYGNSAAIEQQLHRGGEGRCLD